MYSTLYSGVFGYISPEWFLSSFFPRLVSIHPFEFYVVGQLSKDLVVTPCESVPCKRRSAGGEDVLPMTGITTKSTFSVINLPSSLEISLCR